jgi:MFS family permease
VAQDRLPRTFWFLFAGALINRTGSFVVPLFAIYLTGERGLSPTAAGWVIAAYGLGSLCSGPLGGTLADRIGRRPTLLFGFTWGAGAMLLVPLAGDGWSLIAATFHLGLATDLYRPAIHAAVADLCGPAQRPRAYGLLYWAVNLGFAIAAAIGGAAAHTGFARLFVADAATTLCFAAIIFAFVPETRAASERDAAARGDDGGYGEVVADGLLVTFLAVQVLVGLQFLQAHGALPIALGARGITAAQYGLIVGSNGIYIILLQPIGLRLIARMRRSRALALGALFVGAGFGLNALPLGVAGAAASVFVWTLGEILASPVVPAVLADLAPAPLRARYQGMGQVSYGVCALLGPPTGMWVFEHGSASWLWGGCLVLGLIAACGHLLIATRLRARLGDRGQAA